MIGHWPEEIEHVVLLLVTGGGTSVRTPMMPGKFLDFDMYDSTDLSQAPQDVLRDAFVLKAHVLREERPI